MEKSLAFYWIYFSFTRTSLFAVELAWHPLLRRQKLRMANHNASLQFDHSKKRLKISTLHIRFTIVICQMMAEHTLYGNDSELMFPFHLVKPHLSWLPGYLAAADETPLKLLDFLNIVLVFGRARTATLQYIGDLPVCRSLVDSLNSALDRIGGEALHHRLEVVRRGPRLFFVTCRNSPRFNWKTHLTHLEIGRNLDYSAPGHVFVKPFPPRGICQFVERTSMECLFAECVLLESLQDSKANGELLRFNSRKEALFNDVMEQLGLRYRFKWVFITPERIESVQCVMSEPTPPSKDWWEENCVFVDIGGTTEILPALRFCNFLSLFDKYWPLVQHMFHFVAEHETMNYESADAEILFPSEHWRAGRQLYAEVRETLVMDMPPDEFADRFEYVRKRCRDLLEAGQRFRSDASSESKYPRHVTYYTPVFRPSADCMKAFLRSIWEECLMRVSQRWKLRRPLVYTGLPYSNKSVGYHLCF